VDSAIPTRKDKTHIEIPIQYVETESQRFGRWDAIALGGLIMLTANMMLFMRDPGLWPLLLAAFVMEYATYLLPHLLSPIGLRRSYVEGAKYGIEQGAAAGFQLGLQETQPAETRAAPTWRELWSGFGWRLRISLGL
jgi:hypothetical protein